MRLLGLALLGLGVGLIGMFCVVYPPVSAGSDYAAVNGIGFVVGPIGLVLVLAGVAMMFERGGPPRVPWPRASRAKGRPQSPRSR